MSIDNAAIKSSIDSFLTGIAGLPTYGWADRNFVPSFDAQSIRVNLLPTKKCWLSSGNGIKEATGLILFEIWAPVGSESIADSTAAQIESLLLSTRQIAQILLNECTAQEGRYVDGMYRVNVKLSWFSLSQ